MRIVFGTNAQLNVCKAFVGSAANSLDLVDAGRRQDVSNSSQQLHQLIDCAAFAGGLINCQA